MLKSNISDIYSHKEVKIKINPDDHLPLEKTLNIHNAVLHIESVFNKNHNHYYYQAFLQKMFLQVIYKYYIITE